jgi:glutathione S-transferase
VKLLSVCLAAHVVEFHGWTPGFVKLLLPPRQSRGVSFCTRLIPENIDAALKVRFMDRFFDNYVMTPMQTLVSDRMRTEGQRDAQGASDARNLLDIAYRWLDKQVAQQAWAAGSDFTLADCAAAPALFYADWVHPIGDQFPTVRAYRGRLLARPSIARTVDEVRPNRKLFPLGAPRNGVRTTAG